MGFRQVASLSLLDLVIISPESRLIPSGLIPSARSYRGVIRLGASVSRLPWNSLPLGFVLKMEQFVKEDRQHNSLSHFLSFFYSLKLDSCIQ